MTTWDLNRLRYTVRKITGKYDLTQLPDTSSGENSFTNPPGLDDYINDYYLYEMPEDLRSLRLRDFYTFTTVPNCGTYSVPQNVLELYEPVYIDNYQYGWHQDPTSFYTIWPELDFIDQNLLKGNGITTTFTFTLTQTPVQQGTVVIGLIPNLDGSPSPVLETFTDQDQPIPLDIPVKQYFVNPAPLTGNQGGTGTIDYLTGVCTVTYVTAPPSGTSCSCHYHPYVASRPRDIMFWQQQLFIRPIPNDTYSVKMMSYVLPTTVLSAATNATQRPSLYVDPATTPTSAPTPTTVSIQGFSGNSGSLSTDLTQFNEFWQLVAYGASIKILIEDGDHEAVALNQPYYEKARLLVQRKTLKQLAKSRIPTRYADNYMGGQTWPTFPLY